MINLLGSLYYVLVAVCDISCLEMITEKFYELKKQQARDGITLYRKFVVKMDRINEFMKVAQVGSMSDVARSVLFAIAFCCRKLELRDQKETCQN